MSKSLKASSFSLRNLNIYLNNPMLKKVGSFLRTCLWDNPLLGKIFLSQVLIATCYMIMFYGKLDLRKSRTHILFQKNNTKCLLLLEKLLLYDLDEIGKWKTDTFYRSKRKKDSKLMK